MPKKKHHWWRRWWRRRRRPEYRSLDHSGYVKQPVPRTLREALDYRRRGLIKIPDWWISPTACFYHQGRLWVYLDAPIEWSRQEWATVLYSGTFKQEPDEVGAVFLPYRTWLETLVVNALPDRQDIAPVHRINRAGHDMKGRVVLSIR